MISLLLENISNYYALPIDLEELRTMKSNIEWHKKI